MIKLYIKRIMLVFFSILSIFFIIVTIISRKNKIQAIENNIPIVMSTDNNYVYPTCVTITSLLENGNKNTFYKIFVLSSKDLSEENCKKICSIESKYKNCNINIKKIGEDYNKYENYKYFTKAIFFRLKIPSVLCDEQKCIYIDTDTIVRKDLSELYSIDISNYYIAGVCDGTGIRYKEEFEKKLNMPQEVSKKYINSGVLLWNLNKIRKDNIEPKFDEFVNQKVFKEKLSIFGDQDCINMVCAGNILNLHPKYNFARSLDPGREYNRNSIAKNCYSEKEWNEALSDPVIVHYNSNRKPWNCLKLFRIELWWEYANNSLFAEEIREKYSRYKR